MEIKRCGSRPVIGGPGTLVAGVWQTGFCEQFLGRRTWNRFHVDIDRLDIRFGVEGIFADFDAVRRAPDQVGVVEVAVRQDVFY